MILKNKRIFSNNIYSIGHLTVDGVYECDILEDTDRGLTSDMPEELIKLKKVYGKTAIPKGEYLIDMNTVSPKFKDRSWAKFCDGKLPRLIDVPGFDGVLIHVGNKPEDTLGCLLVGLNKVKGQVISSTETFTILYNKMLAAHKRGEKITLIIE